jgi:hypothetical protein
VNFLGGLKLNTAIMHDLDKASVLAEAFLKAGKNLGDSQSELDHIMGKKPSAINRAGIEPSSKTGELALLF